MKRRYRIKARAVLQHRSGGRCHIKNNYFRRSTPVAALAALNAWISLLEAKGYELVELTTVEGWLS